MRCTLISLSIIVATGTLTACGGSSNDTSPSVTPTVNANTSTANNPKTNSSVSSPTILNNNPFSAKINLSSELMETYKNSGTINKLDYTLNNKSLPNGILDTKTLENGASIKTLTAIGQDSIDGEVFRVTRQENYFIYQQPHSIVIGKSDGSTNIAGMNMPSISSEVDLFYIDGNPSKTLPTAGTARYKGQAPTQQGVANFNYSVDFNKKTGSGSIIGAGHDIQLKEGSISQVNFYPDHRNTPTAYQHGITGRADVKGTSWTGDYKLGFFGDNASEVAGYLDHPDFDIGDIVFGGSKQ